jgi:hypothetical protein
MAVFRKSRFNGKRKPMMADSTHSICANVLINTAAGAGIERVANLGRASNAMRPVRRTKT